MSCSNITYNPDFYLLVDRIFSSFLNKKNNSFSKIKETLCCGMTVFLRYPNYVFEVPYDECHKVYVKDKKTGNRIISIKKINSNTSHVSFCLNKLIYEFYVSSSDNCIESILVFEKVNNIRKSLIKTLSVDLTLSNVFVYLSLITE